MVAHCVELLNHNQQYCPRDKANIRDKTAQHVGESMKCHVSKSTNLKGDTSYHSKHSKE